MHLFLVLNTHLVLKSHTHCEHLKWSTTHRVTTVACTIIYHPPPPFLDTGMKTLHLQIITKSYK